ncbi:MAG: hypothetical protein ACLUTA_12330 [Blautia wexlerae]
MSGKKRNAMLFVLLFTLLAGSNRSGSGHSRCGGTKRQYGWRIVEDADFINKSSSGVYQRGYGVEYLNKISPVMPELEIWI